MHRTHGGQQCCSQIGWPRTPCRRHAAAAGARWWTQCRSRHVQLGASRLHRTCPVKGAVIAVAHLSWFAHPVSEMPRALFCIQGGDNLMLSWGYTCVELCYVAHHRRRSACPTAAALGEHRHVHRSRTISVHLVALLHQPCLCPHLIQHLHRRPGSSVLLCFQRSCHRGKSSAGLPRSTPLLGQGQKLRSLGQPLRAQALRVP